MGNSVTQSEIRNPPPPRSGKSAILTRRGFSFTEVLFAVMILGIGFIMIAAIFPVSLSQTKATSEETAGTQIARSAVAMIDEVTSQTLMASTNGAVVPFNAAPNPDLFRAIGGNYIIASDNRRAWVPFYRRDSTWNYAQIWLVPVEVRNRTAYTPGEDIYNASSAFIAKSVNISSSDAAEQYVTLSGPGLSSVVEGAYMIIQNDTSGGYMTGRVYRISAPHASMPNTWYLAPGADMQRDPGPDGLGNTGDDVTSIRGGLTAWIVGKGYAAGSTTGEGAAQDVGVYTTYVNLK